MLILDIRQVNRLMKRKFASGGYAITTGRDCKLMGRNGSYEFYSFVLLDGDLKGNLH